MIAIWQGTFTAQSDLGYPYNINTPQTLYQSGSFEVTTYYNATQNGDGGDVEELASLCQGYCTADPVSGGIEDVYHGPVTGFDTSGLVIESATVTDNTYYLQSTGSILLTSRWDVPNNGEELNFSLNASSPDIPSDPTQVFSTNMVSAVGSVFSCYQQNLCWSDQLSVTSLTVEDYIGEFVPEPTTWTMMLLGFGGVGWMLRINRKRAASVMG
jgi:hypothetical protein